MQKRGSSDSKRGFVVGITSNKRKQTKKRKVGREKDEEVVHPSQAEDIDPGRGYVLLGVVVLVEHADEDGQGRG